MKLGREAPLPSEEGSIRERVRRELGARYFGDEEQPRRRGRLVARLLVVLLCVFVYGLYLETTIPMPDSAWVYVNDRQGVYFPPPYLQGAGQDGGGLLQTTVAEAARLKYRPDPQARELGYFRQEGRSLSGGLLEKLGLLPPLKSRWNRDGTWNW